MTLMAAPSRSTTSRSVTGIEVRALTAEHLDDSVDVLVRGFAEEPRNIALPPDAGSRATRLQVGSRLERGRPMPRATAPELRGQGSVRNLLDRQLLRCDEDGMPAWHETTDPANPPIYERFGSETVIHIEEAACLPGSWVMRREPASQEQGA